MIKFMSEPYTLQEETTCDGQISNSGKLVVKFHYMNSMKINTKWYSEQ